MKAILNTILILLVGFIWAEEQTPSKCPSMDKITYEKEFIPELTQVKKDIVVINTSEINNREIVMEAGNSILLLPDTEIKENYWGKIVLPECAGIPIAFITSRPIDCNLYKLELNFLGKANNISVVWIEKKGIINPTEKIIASNVQTINYYPQGNSYVYAEIYFKDEGVISTASGVAMEESPYVLTSNELWITSQTGYAKNGWNININIPEHLRGVDKIKVKSYNRWGGEMNSGSWNLAPNTHQADVHLGGGFDCGIFNLERCYYSGLTEYWFIIETENCKYTYTDTGLVINSGSIYDRLSSEEEQSQPNEFILSPNPAKQGDKVSLGSYIDQVIISSLDGKIINTFNNISVIDTENLVSGIYYLKTKEKVLKLLIE